MFAFNIAKKEQTFKRAAALFSSVAANAYYVIIACLFSLWVNSLEKYKEISILFCRFVED